MSDNNNNNNSQEEQYELQQQQEEEEEQILNDISNLTITTTISPNSNLQENEILQLDNKTKRLFKEYHNFNLNLENEDIENKLISKIYLENENDLTSDWRIIINGPKDTPYENGYWLLNFSFPDGYPFKAPKIKFLNKVYHCNINEEGIISMDILSTNWAPLLTPYKVCHTIISFLNDSNPLSPLDHSKSTLYLSDRNQFDENCRNWVKLYASSYDDLIKNFNLN